MSEFWVSKKKYWCKYCECFIADDKPSRTHHESGLRHIGNKERFVRQIYKTGEKRKRDQIQEQAEMAAINRAAESSYALDIAQGRGGSTSTAGPSNPSPKPTKPAKPVDKWANYTTAASLGIKDEEAERQALLAAQRSTEGTVGAWEVVVPPPPPLVTESAVDLPQEEDVDVKPGIVLNSSTQAEDEDDVHTFKVRKKTHSYQLDDLFDPGTIKLKKKEQTKCPEGPSDTSDAPEELTLALTASEPAAVSEKGWKSSGWAEVKVTEPVTQSFLEATRVQSEKESLRETQEQALAASALDGHGTAPEEKPVDPDPFSGIKFKKRRGIAASGGRRF